MKKWLGSDWLSSYYHFCDHYKFKPEDIEELFDGLNYISTDIEIKKLFSGRR